MAKDDHFIIIIIIHPLCTTTISRQGRQTQLLPALPIFICVMVDEGGDLNPLHRDIVFLEPLRIPLNLVLCAGWGKRLRG